MSALLCLALLASFLSVDGSDKLPIAFCTPENSQCALASDGQAASCFTASRLQENFYFGVLSTAGQSFAVDKLLLRVGAGRTRAKFTVSLASGGEAHELVCSAGEGEALLACPAGLKNVTSLMVRPEPLTTRLNLLEVAAFGTNAAQVNFTYCDAHEAANCRSAMDHRTGAGSPAAVSGPAQFPSWYGGLAGTEPIRSVKIYRPAANKGETFFRVHAAKECEEVGQSMAEAGGVEVVEFRCSGDPANLLQVVEIDSQFLVSLCEVEVFGQ